MAKMQQEIAEGAKKLVEADAKAREADARAREAMTVMQEKLRGDQAEVGRQRDQLEVERRTIADQRHRDPLVAAAIIDFGLVLACLLPLLVCVYVLWTVSQSYDSDDGVTELLIEEIVAEEPRFLPGSAMDHGQSIRCPTPHIKVSIVLSC
jgi:hypothetical protein